MNKTILLLVFIVAASGCFSKKEIKKTSGNSRPNIIYILADDMGIGDISALNKQAKVTTPNLDKLIQAGMNFTDAHSTSAVCTPTRYGILTGQYSWRTRLKKGVLNGTSRRLISSDVDTAPALLQRNGYQTVMIGKWHLGWDWQAKVGEEIQMKENHPYNISKKSEAIIDLEKPFMGGPVDCGFDYFYGINASLDFGPYTFMEGNKVTTIPIEKFVRRGKKEEGLEARQGFMRGGMIANDFVPETVLLELTQKSVSYINDYKNDKPFFLYLPITAPHTPVLPRSEFEGTSQAGLYGDFIQEVDWTVGQIIDALRKKGLEENTLIIFTADNGASKVSFPEEFEEKFAHQPSRELKGRKGSLSEGGHRVPFIAQWKGKIKPSTRSDIPVSLNDLYATCAEIVGIESPKNQGVDSYSMLPLLFGKSDYKNPSMVYSDFGGRLAIRKGDWKLITNKAKRKRQLYNLKTDKEEQNNLYGQSDYAEKEKELLAALTQVITNGRSNKGKKLENKGQSVWTQLYWMEN